MLEVPGEQNEFELTQLAPVGSALFRLVKQLELVDFCANGLVGRQQARPITPSLAHFFWFSVSPLLLVRVKR
jgi:hypothetical protein